MSQETVVLLHGLARTQYSMAPIARHLRGAGYDVVNVGYPSRQHPIEALAQSHLAPAVWRIAGRVHFVTHSMGGILVRQFLQAPLPQLGRVVMIAPPNQGSELVDRLGALPGFHWINGPAGRQLGTGADSVPNRLGPVSYPVGVIAGNATLNPAMGAMIRGRGDGKVSIERTHVAGMADFVELPFSHTWIMMRRRTLEQVAHFLRHGRFEHH